MTKNRAMGRLLVVLFVLASLVDTTWAQKSVHVKGYTRKDGTYVQPHTKSASGSGSSSGSSSSYVPSSASTPSEADSLTAVALLPLPKNPGPTMGAEEISGYVQRLTAAGTQVRLSVLSEIASRIDPRFAPLAPTIVSLFNDPDWDVRLRSMNTMERLGPISKNYIPEIEAAMAKPELKLMYAGNMARAMINKIPGPAPLRIALAPSSAAVAPIVSFPSVSDGLASCRAEADSLKRLICYDKLAEAK
ncbi:MAG: hypothetical protein ABI672_05530 [Vicinamibacteria bacterium]